MEIEIKVIDFCKASLGCYRSLRGGGLVDQV